jgi:hypothetical protein
VKTNAEWTTKLKHFGFHSLRLAGGGGGGGDRLLLRGLLLTLDALGHIALNVNEFFVLRGDFGLILGRFGLESLELAANELNALLARWPWPRRGLV